MNEKSRLGEEFKASTGIQEGGEGGHVVYNSLLLVLIEQMSYGRRVMIDGDSHQPYTSNP